MKKVLGLDIGVKTIGWALIHEPENDDEHYHIAGTGVRVIPLSINESEEFIKGNPLTKNSRRTVLRSARRNLQRYKIRRTQLLAVLETLKMTPDENLFNLSSLELYRLRDRGVSTRLTLPELGRVFYHLNQKRGYKSNRKIINEAQLSIQTESNEGRKYQKSFLDLIHERERDLTDSALTIGQHFYRQLTVHESTTGEPDTRIKGNIYLRTTYMKEFDRIWATQQPFYPEILTEDIRKKIRDEIIYYQRPLRSKKNLVSNCLFEKYHKAVPKSSPLFQVASIWQQLNNLELISLKAMRRQEDGFNHGKRKLTTSEKVRLFNILNAKEKLSTKACIKALGYPYELDEYKLNAVYKANLDGNSTYAKLKAVFDHFGFSADNLLRFSTAVGPRVNTKIGDAPDRLQTDISFEKEPLYGLWHLVYSIDEAETLVNILRKKFGFPDGMAKAIAGIDFTSTGYGSLSARALRNILPYLEQGYPYAKSCQLAGYHLFAASNENNVAKPPSDRLAQYRKNSLQQPVIEKIFNQAVNLVNAIIDESNGYVSEKERTTGKFEIRIALARPIKQSAGERKETYVNKIWENRRTENIKALIRHALPEHQVVSNDIVRYKLWEEFGQRSPFEPEIQISLKDLLSSAYQIKSIIPRTRLFDDSFHNKTICRRALNANFLRKNNMTIHDFISTKSEQSYAEYLELIWFSLQKNNGISKAKFNKLLMPSKKIPDDFINRQMQEKRFISRKAYNLFSEVCSTVVTTSSNVTKYLCRHWSYDGILDKLNVANNQVLSDGVGRVDDSIENFKRRPDMFSSDDYRHHAIDALVIACTKQDYIRQLNQLNHTQQRREYQFALNTFDKHAIETQKPFTIEEVLNAISSIFISFKPGKRIVSKSTNRIKRGNKSAMVVKETIPRGFLHKETVFGRIRQFEKVKLSPYFDRLNEVVSPDVKRALLHHINSCNYSVRQAFNRPNLVAFKQLNGFDIITVYKVESVVRYKLGINFKAADADYIVDRGVRTVVKDHMARFGNHPKQAFKSDNPVWMNKEKGIQIKSVRCFTGYRDLQALHRNDNGEPIDFVLTRNNHHMAFYKDQDGVLHENTVSLWQAVKRKKAGLPAIITDPAALARILRDKNIDEPALLAHLPQSTWSFVTSLQHNEMFIVGMTNENLIEAVRKKDTRVISAHLYRVQKISRKATGAIDVCFRHHLDTKIEESKAAKMGNKFVHVVRVRDMNALKVEVSILGKLTVK